MLKYKNMVVIILFCSVIIIILGWMFAFIHIWLLIALFLLYVSALAGGALFIDSGLYLTAYCSAKSGKPEIALTFDDGPHSAQTLLVLDILKKHNIKAGFFVIGKNIEGNEHILKRIFDEGHIIGNHSFSHRNTFGFMPTRAVIRDLQKNEDLIKDITGKECALFRPPMGISNPHIAKAVRSLNYKVVGWNIRSFDTLHKNPEKTIRRVEKRLQPGGLILLHDNRENIVPVLEGVIRAAVKNGYTFVSPDTLLELKAYK